MRRGIQYRIALVCALALPGAGLAQPQPLPMLPAAPAPRDLPYPGTIRLSVDATDTMRGIVQVHETVPVTGGETVTLLYPQWLPGEHNPGGPIEKFAGLMVHGGGKAIAWRRDPRRRVRLPCRGARGG